jgi:hypothetical protein
MQTKVSGDLTVSAVRTTRFQLFAPPRIDWPPLPGHDDPTRKEDGMDDEHGAPPELSERSQSDWCELHEHYELTLSESAALLESLKFRDRAE